MQSSHTCHVNKTNFKTLTVLRRITLRSGYCRIMFFSARERASAGLDFPGRYFTEKWNWAGRRCGNGLVFTGKLLRCGNGLVFTGKLLRHCDLGWHGGRGSFGKGHSGKGISRVGLPWPILHREVKLGWTTGGTTGTATATGARVCGVNTRSSSSLSDSESVTSGLGPAGWILLTGGVDDKRGGGRHNVFAVYCTLRATSQWLSHVHIVKWPCCHLMQLGLPEVLDFVAAQHAVA